MGNESNATKVITDYLKRTGIEPEAVAVYLALHKLGPSSALQLAKQTKISRTQVYRHLESLQSYSLASSEQLSYGTLFRPLPVENLEGTLAAREADTAALRQNLSNIVTAMQTLAGVPSREITQVLHYYGLAGIKQANWNLTKANKEFFVFEVAHVNEHFDKQFATRFRERCMERKLVSHDLTNRQSITTKELEPFEPSHTFCRYIDPKVLTINFEVYLYNDIVTLIDYSPESMHAIEICSSTLHAMMQQIYDALWTMATPLEIK